MKWEELYPGTPGKPVEFLDIGCGYGGFLGKRIIRKSCFVSPSHRLPPFFPVELGKLFPDKLALGMEIRVKVSDYVMDRIKALRVNHPGEFQNIACIRTNAMKYLPNFFAKGQIQKMFFLYPDPHFKKAKHKWRIINRNLLTEYSYFLAPGGMIYTISDVQDLHEWMATHLRQHPNFVEVPVDDQLKATDPIVAKLYGTSEEGMKVTRNNGDKFVAIFRRV